MFTGLVPSAVSDIVVWLLDFYKHEVCQMIFCFTLHKLQSVPHRAVNQSGSYCRCLFAPINYAVDIHRTAGNVRVFVFHCDLKSL